MPLSRLPPSGQGLLVPAYDRWISTGRDHSLIATRSRPLNPVVPEIARWLISRLEQEIRQLDPDIESPSPQ
jgi:LysR family transcriptional regulator, glycine cleavage system transcriptional activator